MFDKNKLLDKCEAMTLLCTTNNGAMNPNES